MELQRYISTLKRESRRGRCLYSASGCGRFVDAHSIQRAALLSSVAESGHVIQLSSDIGDLKRSGGRVASRSVGVGRVSTFRGFCDTHDNQLFKPIDSTPLQPTFEQAFLHAYRSLCRELFLKENSVALFGEYASHTGLDASAVEQFEALLAGSQLGLRSLQVEKQAYDHTLAERSWEDMRFLVFHFEGAPDVLVAGAVFPDFDLQGRHLQDLSASQPLSALTFAVVPSVWGASFLFAWHKGSDAVCQRFCASIAEYVHEGGSLDDLLFRLVFSWSSNHAIRPSYWHALPPEHQSQIVHRAMYMVDTSLGIEPTYLQHGLEGVTRWRVTRVEHEY